MDVSGGVPSRVSVALLRLLVVPGAQPPAADTGRGLVIFVSLDVSREEWDCVSRAGRPHAAAAALTVALEVRAWALSPVGP